MPKFKIKKFFNSFRNKVLILSAIAITAAALLITKVFLKNEADNLNSGDSSITHPENPEVKKSDPETFEKTLDKGIDSVLFNFGIKKEWIKTLYESTGGKTASNSPLKSPKWFAKEVLIPKEISTIEINLDITNYIKTVGLSSTVNEDILSKAILINIYNPDSASSNPLLVKVSVKHSGKISRDAGVFAIILDNISSYNDEEIEKYLLNKNEFSFVFPRSLDKVNLQTKLLQNKKEVLINLTVGAKDNYDSDFNMSYDEKTVKEKVKSFSSDYPSISTVILTKPDAEVTNGKMDLISEELNNFNIRVINDSALLKLLTEAEVESKDKINKIVNSLKSKAKLSKTAITVLDIEPDEFEKFYNEILILKKLGHKFYSISEFLSEQEKRQTLEKIKEEKVKQELEEKKKQLKKSEIKQNQKKKIKQTKK